MNKMNWYEVSSLLPPVETEIILVDSIRCCSRWQNLHRKCNIKEYCETYGYDYWTYAPNLESLKSEYIKNMNIKELLNRELSFEERN